jgi:hypothetical protein
MATIAELLYLFRDGQSAKSIGPEAFQALITELHLASGLFQDLPASQAGLANGRLWLNADVVQMATGAMPASPSGNFFGLAAGSLRADPQIASSALRAFSTAFSTAFPTTNLYNTNATVAGAGSVRADPQIVPSTGTRAFDPGFSSAFG